MAPVKRGRLARVLLSGAWVVSLSIPLVLLTAAHQMPLAHGNAPVTTAVTGMWEMKHVLVEGCPCSRSIAQHLLARGPIGGVIERVWIAEGGRRQAWVEELSRRGFEVRRMSEAEIASSTHLSGGPWLLVTDAQGQLRYTGGYLDGRPGLRGGLSPADEQILVRLRDGETVDPMRALGCSIGQSLIQPLGSSINTSN